jgi:hypothetical protein
MKREEKRKNAITGLLNDLWTACAEGSQFKFTEGRAKHRMSEEYASFIKRNCVEETDVPFVYRVKKGVNKDAIIQNLSTKKVSELALLFNRAPKNPRKANKKEVVAETPAPVQSQIGLVRRLKHISPKDTVTNVIRLEEPEVATKKEVVVTTKQHAQEASIEVDDFSGRGLKDCVVTIKVTREYPGGTDSTSFKVKDTMSYLNVVSEVNKFK